MHLLVLLAALLGGAAATYVFEDDAGPLARLAMGAPLGVIGLGLAGYAGAWALGMTAAAVFGAALLSALPILVFARKDARRRLQADLGRARRAMEEALVQPRWATHGLAIAFAMGAFLMWRVQDRALIVGGDGAIATGVDHNLGDLPFHISIATLFLYGGNFPPEHPELSGARLTYPFVMDLVSALLMRAGAGLREAFLLPGLVLSVALLVLLYRWGHALGGSRAAGVLATGLVLFSGGLGFVRLTGDVDPAAGGLAALLRAPTHDYSIVAEGPYRWGNLVITMLMPQRSFLLGLPAFLVVATVLWRAVSPPADASAGAWRRRRLVAAGVMAGLLPLAHAHAFLSAACLLAVFALLFPPRRDGLLALGAAAALALPQVLLAGRGTAMKAQSFLAWQVGWDRGETGLVTFWWLNLGLFLPLLLAALVWRGRRPVVPGPVLRFYLPFLFWFLVPNLLRLSPWIWDNLKFLVFWHVASAPLVSALLVRLVRTGRTGVVAAALAVFVLTVSGFLDVRRVAARKIDVTVFSPEAVAFGRTLREATPPGALVLHAPTYNSEVYLAGRRTLYGYPGHIWSQGLEAGTREADVRAIYEGRPAAASLLRAHGVDYVLVGPREFADLDVREEGFAGFPVVAESGVHRLYRVP